jgi:hypothetical protein
MGEGKRRTWRGRRRERHDASVLLLLLQHCNAAAVCTCNARTFSSVVFINGPRERRPPRGRSLNSTPPRAPRFSHDRGLVAQHPRAGATVLQRQRSPDDWLPATPVGAPAPTTHSFLLLAIYSQIAKGNFI